MPRYQPKRPGVIPMIPAHWTKEESSVIMRALQEGMSPTVIARKFEFGDKTKAQIQTKCSNVRQFVDQHIKQNDNPEDVCPNELYTSYFKKGISLVNLLPKAVPTPEQSAITFASQRITNFDSSVSAPSPSPTPTPMPRSPCASTSALVHPSASPAPLHVPRFLGSMRPTYSPCPNEMMNTGYDDEYQAEEDSEESDVEEGIRIYPPSRKSSAVRSLFREKKLIHIQNDECHVHERNIFKTLFMPWFHRAEQKAELWAIFRPLGAGCSMNFALPSTRELAIRLVCGLPNCENMKKTIERQTGVHLLSTDLASRETECRIDLPYEVVLTPRLERVETDGYLIVKMPLALGVLTWT